MAAIDTYDAVVLGSGEAGKSIAWHLGATGQRVAVVEQRYVGGSCPNIACLPSKNFIHSAAIARTVAASEALGTRVASGVLMREVQVRKRTMVEGLVQMHLNKFATSGCELVMGGGCFIAERTIEVALDGGGTRTLRGERVFLDVGAFASLPALPGLGEAAPLTHVELLDLDTVPERLLILGGSYVGIELAQAMRRLGSRVSVCEREERLLPREDVDIAEAIRILLQDEGIAITTSAQVDRVSGRSGDRVALHAMIGGTQKVIEGSHLLVALGKTPNTAGVRPRSGRHQADSLGLCQRERQAGDDRSRRVGDGRLRGKPGVHAYVVRRFSYRQGQSPRKAAQHHGSAGAFLSLYRTRAGARRTE